MKVLILVLASISIVHCGVLGAASLFGSNGLFGFDDDEVPLNTETRIPASAPQSQMQQSFQRFAGAAGGQSGSFLPPQRPSNQYIPPNPAPSFQRPSQMYGAPSAFSGGSAPVPFNTYLPPSSGNFLPEQTAPPSNVYGAPNLGFPDQSAPAPSQLYGAPDQSAPPSQLYGAPNQFPAPSQLYGAPNFGPAPSGSGGFPTQMYLPPFPSSFPASGGLSTNSAPVLSPPPAPSATPTKKVKTFRIIKETSSARAASPAKTIRIIKESRPHSDSGAVRTIRLVSDGSGSSSGGSTRILRIINDGGDSGGYSSGGATRIVRIVRDGSEDGGSSLGGTKILRILSDGGDSLSSSGSTRVVRLVSDGSSASASSHSKTIRVLHDGDSLRYAPGSGESDDGLLNIIKEHIVPSSGSLAAGSEKVLRIISDGGSSDSSSGHRYASGLGDSGSEKILRIVS